MGSAASSARRWPKERTKNPTFSISLAAITQSLAHKTEAQVPFANK
jgi:hypothetical protein